MTAARGTPGRFGVMVGCLLASRAARAECGAHPRHIEASFEGAGWSPALVGRTQAQLAAGFAALGIDACVRGTRTDAPLARIALLATDTGSAELVLEVDDAVTGKRVSRKLELARYGDTGRALVIAVAAEELVRASWAEIAAERPEPEAATRAPVPVEVERAVTARMPSPPVRLGAAASFAAERTSAGQTLLGADVATLVTPTGLGAFTFLVGFGARRGLDRDVARGTVEVELFQAMAGVFVSPFHAHDARLGPFAGLEVRTGSASVRASERDASVVAGAGSGLTLATTGSLGLRARVAGPIHAWLRADAGAVLAGVRSLDGASAAGGIGGFVYGTRIGAELWFR